MADFFYSAGETVRYVGVVGVVWKCLECNGTCWSWEASQACVDGGRDRGLQFGKDYGWMGREHFWRSLWLNEHANVALPFLVEEERLPNEQGREFAKAVREQMGR